MGSICKVFIFLFVFCSCGNSSHRKFSKTFFVNTDEIGIGETEICADITKNGKSQYNFDREINIIENRLTDTIVVGLSVVPPNYVGKLFYGRFEEEDGEIVALYQKSKNPPIKKICFSKYLNTTSKGVLLMEFTNVADTND